MSVCVEGVVRQEMGKGTCLSTQTQGRIQGEENWFGCGRGSRDSRVSRNLAQEDLSAHRGNGDSELERQNREERPVGCKYKDALSPRVSLPTAASGSFSGM